MASSEDLNLEYFTTAIDWLKGERVTYQQRKWGAIGGGGARGYEAFDDALTPEDWETHVGMYLHRAQVLGLENPLGRQAVAKAAATAVAYLETMFRVHGDVPIFGVPSGEIKGTMGVGEHRG